MAIRAIPDYVLYRIIKSRKWRGLLKTATLVDRSEAGDGWIIILRYHEELMGEWYRLDKRTV
jgi:hypothetical protein